MQENRLRTDPLTVRGHAAGYPSHDHLFSTSLATDEDIDIVFSITPVQSGIQGIWRKASSPCRPGVVGRPVDPTATA